MQSRRVLEHIDPEAIARDTLAFVQVKSETGAEGPGSIFLADLLRREGFDPTLDEVEPGRPNVYAHVAGVGNRGRSLLFNGHVDTIPIGNSQHPGRDGDWIVGRGAEDMKGGLVAMVHAASALRKARVELAGDLWLTGVIGHETPAGKKEGPRRLIRHLREQNIQADAIVIVEGPCALWTASLGSTIFHITITSPRGTIHTIKVPYAENPARWLGRLLVEFERLEREFGEVPAHPLCGREQLNVGLIEAGDYINRLPTPIHVSGTWRWMPGKTREDIQAALQALCGALAKNPGCSSDSPSMRRVSPSKPAPTTRLFKPSKKPGGGCVTVRRNESACRSSAMPICLSMRPALRQCITGRPTRPRIPITREFRWSG